MKRTRGDVSRFGVVFHAKSSQPTEPHAVSILLSSSPHRSANPRQHALGVTGKTGRTVFQEVAGLGLQFVVVQQAVQLEHAEKFFDGEADLLIEEIKPADL